MKKLKRTGLAIAAVGLFTLLSVEVWAATTWGGIPGGNIWTQSQASTNGAPILPDAGTSFCDAGVSLYGQYSIIPEVCAPSGVLDGGTLNAYWGDCNQNLMIPVPSLDFSIPSTHLKRCYSPGAASVGVSWGYFYYSTNGVQFGGSDAGTNITVSIVTEKTREGGK